MLALTLVFSSPLAGSSGPVSVAGRVPSAVVGEAFWGVLVVALPLRVAQANEKAVSTPRISMILAFTMCPFSLAAGLVEGLAEWFHQ